MEYRLTAKYIVLVCTIEIAGIPVEFSLNGGIPAILFRIFRLIA
jgi:hypothetical protein